MELVVPLEKLLEPVGYGRYYLDNAISIGCRVGHDIVVCRHFDFEGVEFRDDEIEMILCAVS